MKAIVDDLCVELILKSSTKVPRFQDPGTFMRSLWERFARSRDNADY